MWLVNFSFKKKKKTTVYPTTDWIENSFDWCSSENKNNKRKMEREKKQKGPREQQPTVTDTSRMCCVWVSSSGGYVHCETHWWMMHSFDLLVQGHPLQLTKFFLFRHFSFFSFLFVDRLVGLFSHLLFWKKKKQLSQSVQFTSCYIHVWVGLWCGHERSCRVHRDI